MSKEWSTETSRGCVFERHVHLLSLMDIFKANVLIDEAKRARLADFGLLTVVSDTTNLVSSTPFTQVGTHRWMSPELFDPENFGLEDSRPTEHSDCYALGMLIYEVLSGQVPLSQYHGYAVVVRILKGERPDRPADGRWFTNEVWGILEGCWKPTPGDRPRIKDVLECLNNASMSWTQPSSQTVASPPAVDSPAWILDSSVEGGMEESEISSPQERPTSKMQLMPFRKEHPKLRKPQPTITPIFSLPQSLGFPSIPHQLHIPLHFSGPERFQVSDTTPSELDLPACAFPFFGYSTQT